jgi:hypothetical protein
LKRILEAFWPTSSFVHQDVQLIRSTIGPVVLDEYCGSNVPLSSIFPKVGNGKGLEVVRFLLSLNYWADGGSYYIRWTNGLIVVAKHHYVETLRLFLDVMVQCIITSTFLVSEFVRCYSD